VYYHVPCDDIFNTLLLQLTPRCAVQVGLLLGDLMEVIERKVEEENRRTAALQKESALGGAGSGTPSGGSRSGAVSLAGSRLGRKASVDSGLPREGEGNKLAGFFV
jgi:hypothetical protein